MSDSRVKIRFNFIKSPLFRVVHADGVYGGLTPRRELFVGFYAERFPIPTSIAHEFDGIRLGPEIRSEREGRNGILREVEVGVHLDIEVAKALVTWLNDKIEEFEKTEPKKLSRVEPKSEAGEAIEPESLPEEPVQ